MDVFVFYKFRILDVDNYVKFAKSDKENVHIVIQEMIELYNKLNGQDLEVCVIEGRELPMDLIFEKEK